jgi:hypothetical protein
VEISAVGIIPKIFIKFGKNWCIGSQSFLTGISEGIFLLPTLLPSDLGEMLNGT